MVKKKKKKKKSKEASDKSVPEARKHLSNALSSGYGNISTVLDFG